MKKKVIRTLIRKEEQLKEVLELQKLPTTDKDELIELEKNEIQIRAKIDVLRFLLS